MTAMKPRQAILDQVTYLFEPGGFIIPAEDKDITGPLDLCGKTVTALQGSQDLGIVEKFSAECVKAGNSEINISVFTDKNGAVMAVESGRADANVGARMSHSFAVKNSKNKLKIARYIFQGAPLGITMPKETRVGACDPCRRPSEWSLTAPTTPSSRSTRCRPRRLWIVRRLTLRPCVSSLGSTTAP
jgi:hypothetical protein